MDMATTPAKVCALGLVGALVALRVWYRRMKNLERDIRLGKVSVADALRRL